MAFRTFLVVRAIDERFWKLESDLVYEGSKDHFVVPEGYRTDFASVPRMFWWLIPRYGRYTEAAVLHDFLCDESKEKRFNRCDADGIFRRTLRELGVGYLRRRLMWAAVRWGGGVRTCGWQQFALVLVITRLALPLLVPAAVVFAFLLIFWVVALVVWAIRKLLGWEPTPVPRMLPR